MQETRAATQECWVVFLSGLNIDIKVASYNSQLQSLITLFFLKLLLDLETPIAPNFYILNSAKQVALV
jgi:hypothetical protein